MHLNVFTLHARTHFYQPLTLVGVVNSPTARLILTAEKHCRRLIEKLGDTAATRRTATTGVKTAAATETRHWIVLLSVDASETSRVSVVGVVSQCQNKRCTTL